VKDYARLRITPPMGRHPCERSTHSSQDLSGCATGSRCGSDWDRARPVVRQNARCSARGSLSQLDSDQRSRSPASRIHGRVLPGPGGPPLAHKALKSEEPTTPPRRSSAGAPLPERSWTRRCRLRANRRRQNQTCAWIVGLISDQALSQMSELEQDVW